MRAALVDASGNIVNIIVVDSLSDPVPDGLTLVELEEGYGIGDRWDSTNGFRWSEAVQDAYDSAVAEVEASAYNVR